MVCDFKTSGQTNKWQNGHVLEKKLVYLQVSLCVPSREWLAWILDCSMWFKYNTIGSWCWQTACQLESCKVTYDVIEFMEHDVSIQTESRV